MRFKLSARWFVIGIVWVLASQHVSAVSVKQCRAEAKTDTEKVYCELLEKGKGQALPNFYDFKRNPPSTQLLILRGPAKRAGIPLPEVKKPKTQTVTSAPSPKATPKVKNTSSPSTTGSRAQSRASTSFNELDKCTVQQDKIVCNESIYYLVINVPVQRLNQRVLSEDNRLVFNPPLTNETTLQYLSRLYPSYIEKMLLIGLGDSTMSFTKFAGIYETSKQQKENFTERFSEMYELLKNERRTMGVQQRYRNNYPSGIESCMQLSDEIVACDNVEQNWVYQKLRR